MIGVSFAVMLLAGLLVFLFFKPMGLTLTLLGTLIYFLSFAYLFSYRSDNES